MDYRIQKLYAGMEADMNRWNSRNNLIWKIEDMELLTDTFRTPMPSRVFHTDGVTVKGWPSFHVSNADPDGKYQKYEYSVCFELKEAKNTCLHIGCIASTPRLPDLDIVVNGIQGTYYPYLSPSRDKEIKPSHALHAAIYNREDNFLYLPAALLQAGRNTITFTARDDLPVEHIWNDQAVLRLDRMADACGFHYGALELFETDELPESCDVEMHPSVIYKQDTQGNLVEECSLRVKHILNRQQKLQGKLLLCWEDGEKEIPYELEAPAFGQIKFEFLLPDGKGKVQYKLEGDLTGAGEFERKRKWKVYTTPHAHTDIGYTHRQWEVAERMCRNIDTALDMLKDNNQDQFAYIIDSTWHLEEYLNTRSIERKEELIEAVKNGKFGVPANYADLLTWLPSLEAFIHNNDYAAELLAPYELTADRADIVDVASATGAYPAILSGSGVKYLIHADNQDRGPFRFNGELHRHSPFWWKSPDGSRVLTWLARMYCELKKVCGSPASLQAAHKGLEMWLMDYERDNYAPDAVLLYGQEADNTDIDTRTGAFMSKWNETVVYPKLIPSDGSAFFDYVMKFSDSFEEYSGDEGAYWEDGAASSVRETFAVRHADAGIRCAEVLDSLAVIHGSQLKFPVDHYKEAWRQVLLYDEHTWGAFLSGSDADSILQRDQWAVKSHMANQAEQWKNRLITQAASKISLMWNNNSREIVVYNPYSFPVQDRVTVEFAAGETIFYHNGKEADWAETGRTATQVTAELLVNTLQPFSYRRYYLKPANTSDHGGRVHEEILKGKAYLSNDWYEVIINTETGCILSLFDKELKKEICGAATLGQLLYAHGGENSTLLGNRPGLNHDGADIRPAFFPQKAILRQTHTGDSIIIEGLAELGTLKLTYTLPRNEKNLRLEYNYDKEETEKLEAVYVDFPFAVSNQSEIYSDHQTGWVNWSKDILPGACREWLPLQTSILLKGDQCDIQIASPDAFLFTVGTPVQGKWTSDIETRGNRIYSYVLNNYWRVNYQGKQGGQIRFSYNITSAGTIPYEQAYRFGWLGRQGLIAHRMSYQEFRTDIPEALSKEEGGVLLETGSDQHITVSTIRGAKDGIGFLVRLQEIGGRKGEAELKFPGRIITKVVKADHQERPQKELFHGRSSSFTFSLNQWEVSSYRIILE
jgi:alpha-mannosidase